MAESRIIVTAKNQTSQGLNDAKKSVQGLEDTISKLGSKLGKVVSITTATVALKKLGDAAVACFNEFNSSSRIYQQMQLSLGNGEAYKKVTSTINTLSKQTLEGKSSIESMVSQLAALGHSAEEIEKISSASVYLSNVTGKSLNESMNMLLGTYQGSTEELKKLGLEVGNFSKAELASGAAVDEVIDSLQGYSEAIAEVSTNQHLANISNTWTDIKRTIGDIVDTSLSPLIESFDSTISDFSIKFQEFAGKVKIAITNLPEFLEGVTTFVNNIIRRLFSYESIKSYCSFLITAIPRSFQLAMNSIASILSAALTTLEGVGRGISNYVMYLVTSLCNDIGLDLNGLINNIGTWLTESNVGRVIDAIISTAVNGTRTVGALIKNIPQMVKIVSENIVPIVKNLFISIKNFFLQSIADMVAWLGQTLERINFNQMIENVRVAFTNLFGRVGGFFTSIGETAKDTFRYIGEILEVTLSWDTLKTIITTLFKNIGVVLSAWLSTVFGTLPSMIASVFEGVVEWIAYISVKIKNSLLGAIQGAINNAGKKIQGTWVGKVFGLGDTLASIDLGIDTSKEEQLLKKAKNSFSNVGTEFTKAIDRAVIAAADIKENRKDVADKYSGVEGVKVAENKWTDVEAKTVDSGEFVEALYTWADSLEGTKEDNSGFWGEIGAEFDKLLSPIIEEWESSTGETIGQKLSKVVLKDSKSYLALAEESFSSIGDFFAKWGAEFLAENKEGFEAIWADFSEWGKVNFGDSFAEFEAWMNGFFTSNTPKEEETPTDNSTDKGKKSDSSDDSNDTHLRWKDMIDSLKNAWSEHFDKESINTSFINNLSSGFGELLDAMGPIIDICTSSNPLIAFLMQILAEMCEDLAPFVKDVLEPLNLVISLIAESLSSWFIPILKALKPIISLLAEGLAWIAVVFDYVGDAIWWAISRFLNFLAGFHLGGWYPFEDWKVEEGKAPDWDRSRDEIMGEYKEGVFGEDTSTSTSVKTASYTGSNNYYFNIYQQAPVVGNGGMQEFAKMIKAEFAELAYLGA